MKGSMKQLSIESDLMERSREQHREREAAREKERQSNRRIRRYLLAAVSVAVVAVLALTYLRFGPGVRLKPTAWMPKTSGTLPKQPRPKAEGQKQNAELQTRPWQ